MTYRFIKLVLLFLYLVLQLQLNTVHCVLLVKAFAVTSEDVTVVLTVYLETSLCLNCAQTKDFKTLNITAHNLRQVGWGFAKLVTTQAHKLSISSVRTYTGTRIITIGNASENALSISHTAQKENAWRHVKMEERATKQLQLHIIEITT